MATIRAGPFAVRVSSPTRERVPSLILDQRPTGRVRRGGRLLASEVEAAEVEHQGEGYLAFLVAVVDVKPVTEVDPIG